MFIRHPTRLILRVLAFATLVLGAVIATYQVSRQIELADLQATGRHRLDLYAASLEREIGKYAYFPATLGLEHNVLELLSNPKARGDGDPANRVNSYLEQLNERAGTLAIYVLDSNGRVMASSNWRRPDSYIGEDLSFRPYFREAIDAGNGHFFGIGTTHNEPGYYLSSALVEDGRILGVAVIKVSLELLEKSWSTVEAPVIVSDENGVVILTSVPDWKFTTLRELDEKTRNAFDRTLQYNRRALQLLGVRQTTELEHGAYLVRVAREKRETISVYPVTGQFLTQSEPLPGNPWTLTVFSHLEQVDEISSTRAAIAGVTMALLCILALMINERRRHLRDRLAAREALQKAYDNLERKVAERTLDLSRTNQKLQDEVSERVRAEQTLRATQDELIQAGKLAVIGRLSAGIAHELNQPLAALRTLSGNTKRFLERGDESTARSNLERIGQLVDRMGMITGQLKAYAHKANRPPRPVDVRPVVANALSLLEHRLDQTHTRVTTDFPEQAFFALCDPNRLEQVMANLIGNAVDAMAGQAEPCIEINGSIRGGSLRIEVRDHGTGLSDEARNRLFEPFFTTKEAGVGLGLGLAISAGIVTEFGGTLAGDNHPAGGAVFTLEISRAEESTES